MDNRSCANPSGNVFAGYKNVRPQRELPPEGTQYYCISVQLGKLSVISSTFMNDTVDHNRIDSHNFFNNVNDADELLSKIKLLFNGDK